ncbi:MAG: hypothetical protein QM710_13005 [Flavobacterium sp.]
MRSVSTKTLIDLLKEKKRFFSLGSIFILASVFVLFPMVVFMISTFFEPYQKYDTKAILSKGTTEKATITSTRPVTNISVNGQHPLEISYVYDVDGKEIEDRFQTMDLDKAANLRGGSIINIKSYGNESVITSLKPYSFPFEFMLVLPFVFLVLGIVFFSIALFPALKKYKLYKNGVVTDAHFIGISLFSSTPLANDRMANVDYYFTKNGHTVYGTSTTAEFLPISLKTKDDIIKVFVNPEDESQSCYIPKSAIQKNNWNIRFD